MQQTPFASGLGNLITDVEGLMVGNAEDHAIKTGTTILVGKEPFVAGVHVMGGAPGTRETDLLAADKTVQNVDALMLSGGSAFGLDAAAGVMDELVGAGRGFKVGPARVPIVPAAILFDLTNGGNKEWLENPYRRLGVQAFKNASDTFPLGSVGAGTGALTANLKGGLGSASLVLESGVTVGALVAANPLGSVVTEDGTFYAAPFEIGEELGGQNGSPAKLSFADTLRTQDAVLSGARNTTIAIVATDAALSKSQATRLAIAAHDGIARAIIPSHTPMDGDLVFAVSTCQKPLKAFDEIVLGHAAANCLSRAIARAIHAARPYPNDILPTWEEKFGH
ncbi:peptidase T4 [Gracilaria domingensis]|nr:peptidase T4 [Gracilaria domingensis]